jgi:hypothetical protein
MSLETIDLSNETLDELHLAAISASISACDCGTKTPELKFHARSCRYRVLLTQDSVIWSLRNQIALMKEETS